MNKDSLWKIRSCSTAKADILWQLSHSQNGKIIRFSANVDGLEGVEYQHVLMDLPRWDAYWQQQGCNFVPSPLKDWAEGCCESQEEYLQELKIHQQKIARWRPRIQKAEPIPAVCMRVAKCDHDVQFQIQQGRHRIVALREFGVSCFAAAIPSGELSAIASLLNSLTIKA